MNLRQQMQMSGICLGGVVCVALAVLKLTSAVHWSWWRVLLPLWAVLGHNLLYVTVGFVCIFFAENRSGEEATIRQDRDCYSYQLWGLLCFLVFVDSLLKRIEGPDGNGMWLGLRGSWEMILVFGALSVTCQLLFWTEVIGLGDRRAGEE